MIKRKHFFVVLCLFYIVNIHSQELNVDDLLGKWNSYKITTLEGGDGSDITFDGKPFSEKIMMNFIDSKTMLFSINGSEEYKVEYVIKGNQMSIAHRKYTIKVLTDKEMTLKEEKLLGNLIYLKKDDD
ncbi:hypothetical protein [Gelidibacter japonicus]|uniref:hypothetical protein n=1 Tax=Gelidibacter japonicus TaxID=1962232 RepID=UPI002AFE129D|nr:hypothetical protein [Gelidibacter japonicus]